MPWTSRFFRHTESFWKLGEHPEDPESSLEFFKLASSQQIKSGLVTSPNTATIDQPERALGLTPLVGNKDEDTYLTHIPCAHPKHSVLWFHGFKPSVNSIFSLHDQLCHIPYSRTISLHSQWACFTYILSGLKRQGMTHWNAGLFFSFPLVSFRGHAMNAFLPTEPWIGLLEGMLGL